MQRKAILIAEIDSVLTVLEPVCAGDIVSNGQDNIPALEDIPLYHKISRKPLQPGEAIYKYGQCMGYATAAIAVGQWVHTHNAASHPAKEEEASC